MGRSSTVVCSCPAETLSSSHKATLQIVLPGASVNRGKKKHCTLRMRGAQNAAINMQGGFTERGKQALKLSPSPHTAKEEQVRTKVALMITMAVVALVTLVGSAGAAFAQ